MDEEAPWIANGFQRMGEWRNRRFQPLGQETCPCRWLHTYPPTSRHSQVSPTVLLGYGHLLEPVLNILG
jgi:hypothetical protein